MGDPDPQFAHVLGSSDEQNLKLIRAASITIAIGSPVNAGLRNPIALRHAPRRVRGLQDCDSLETISTRRPYMEKRPNRPL